MNTILSERSRSAFRQDDDAVKALGWQDDYHVDADHINLATVGRFLHCSDFFTIDVGDAIGEAASDADITAFVERHGKYIGTLDIPGAGSFEVTKADLEAVARTFLKAVQTAGVIYRHIADERAMTSSRRFRWMRQRTLKHRWKCFYPGRDRR